MWVNTTVNNTNWYDFPLPNATDLEDDTPNATDPQEDPFGINDPFSEAWGDPANRAFPSAPQASPAPNFGEIPVVESEEDPFGINVDGVVPQVPTSTNPLTNPYMVNPSYLPNRTNVPSLINPL